MSFDIPDFIGKISSPEYLIATKIAHRNDSYERLI